jgi:hypothetical protein
MSKYLPLGEYLRNLGVSRVQLSFEEVVRLVGELPPSARQYRAWWANEPRTHSHARAWLEAGWRVDAVNLGRWVSFARVSAPPRPLVAAPPLVIRPPAARLQGERHPRESTFVSNSLTAGPADTLLVLPCSARKRGGGIPGMEGRKLLEDLPAELADRLQAARARNAAEASVDETLLLPAFRRYAGTLYEAAGDSIQQAIRAGWHILILSGGYGLVRADEPIGDYDALLQVNRWPGNVIQDSLVAYAYRHGLVRAITFAGGSTPYAEVARRTAWKRSGLGADLLSPEVSGGGAMVKTPRALGEALVQLLGGGLPSGWASSDGVSLSALRLG